MQLKFNDFWMMFKSVLPRLFEQVTKINLLSATSVPAESIFSIAGYVQRKERSRLSSKMLRFLILTRQSYKTLEKIKFIVK